MACLGFCRFLCLFFGFNDCFWGVLFFLNKSVAVFVWDGLSSFSSFSFFFLVGFRLFSSNFYLFAVVGGFSLKQHFLRILLGDINLWPRPG